jgi:hypothetical protein
VSTVNVARLAQLESSPSRHMLQQNLTIILLLWMCTVSFATETCSPGPKKINIDLWSTKSLLSPDGRWEFRIIGPKKPEGHAALYLRNIVASKRWKVGSIERDGTVFWSNDSKRLFLIDEYAADDTRIRILDVTRTTPNEIAGLDDKIRRVIFRHVPDTRTTLWLTYPLASMFRRLWPLGGSSQGRCLLGHETGGGSGMPFGLRLKVNLATSHVEERRVRE